MGRIPTCVYIFPTQEPHQPFTPLCYSSAWSGINIEGITTIMLRKRWRTVTIAMVVIILVGGGYAYYARTRQAQAAVEPQLQTATVRTGSIVVSATGSGTLIAARTIDLGFRTSEQVSEVLVEVGDHVEEGEVLAKVDDTSARIDLVQAELNLQSLTGAQAIADAQAALADAQAELKDATYKWQVNQPGHRATSETLDYAQAQLDIAQSQFESAQENYDGQAWRSSDDPSRVAAASQLGTARTAYYTALGNLNWYTGKPTEIEEAQLEAAVAQAEATVASAQAYLHELTGNSTAEDADASPSQALLQLRQAKLSVESAETELEATQIVAPIPGTVTSLDLIVGGESGEGSAISLADLSQPTLNVYLDESDLTMVAVGNEADVVFDAYPDLTLTGQVTEVYPELVTFEGVSAVQIIIELDANDPALPAQLPVGLSATVDVISARATNALLVSVDALRELSAGQYGVFVLEDGQLKLRTVEVGLMDLTSAEIVSGLEEGEIVSTGVVETGQ